MPIQDNRHQSCGKEHNDRCLFGTGKAAKQAFDELKIEKLPTIKMLQERYAALEAERKTTYSSYRQAREDMRNLLTAKANVDRLLGYDAHKTEKGKEQERR